MSNPLEEAASMAFDNISNSNPAPAVEKPMVTEVPKQEPVAEAPKHEEGETFTKLNPNELPEDLKPYYKSLLSDYTKKRQSESARVKQLEAELTRYKSTPSQPYQQQDPSVATEESTEELVKRMVQEQQESFWDKQAIAEYPKIDPRLDEGNPVEYDRVMDDFVRSRLSNALDEYVSENGTKIGFDYKSAVKDTIGEWETYVDNSVKAYIAKQNKLVKEKEVATKKASPSTSSATSVKNTRMSIDEALEAALATND